MGPNPVLKKLGFDINDRIVIIHTDDIGMCHASVGAFQELWDHGIISSGATMVPCPWFPTVSALCRNNPKMDLGVHLTLTSEWDGYRWGPVSTRDPLSGLIDDEGYFYRTSEDAQIHGNPDHVHMEINIQIEKALAAGIDVTHVDTHMGTVGTTKFIPSYLSLSAQFGLPAMLMRLDKDGWLELGFDEKTAEVAVQMVNQLEEQGVPLIDHLAGLELNIAQEPEERLYYAKSVLDNLKTGITHFIIHPSQDTPELRAITPDWKCRVADYLVFKNDIMRDFIKESGIHVIGYRMIKDLM